MVNIFKKLKHINVLFQVMKKRGISSNFTDMTMKINHAKSHVQDSTTWESKCRFTYTIFKSNNIRKYLVPFISLYKL